MDVRQLFYLSTMLAVIGSNAVLDGRGYAARQAKPVHATMDVRLCTSLPIGFPPFRQLSRGIENSVMLATEQWRARFQAVQLALLPPVMLDEAENGTRDLKREEQDARACVRRQDTFGYVGPLNSGEALVSEPILNRAAMVQINPSNTLPNLTSPIVRARVEPATYQHWLAYLTYYRVITTDFMQGPADAAYLKEKLHADTYFVVDDTLTYGAGIAGAVQAYGAKIGLRLVGSAHLDPRSSATIASSSDTVSDLIVAKHPDGVFYGGDCPGAGFLGSCGVLAQDLRRKGYSGPLVGGDALHNPDFIKLAGDGAVNSYASETGFDIVATSKSFRQAYQRRFHTLLQLYDAPAYDAANINLYAIYMAATHGTFRGSLFQMRTSILPYVAHVRWHGATGVTSFDKNGDNRHRVISVYKTRNGKWVFAGAAPQVTGVSPAG
jgi:branched-chain amino acid transport system substrate-binding protein